MNISCNLSILFVGLFYYYYLLFVDRLICFVHISHRFLFLLVCVVHGLRFPLLFGLLTNLHFFQDRLVCVVHPFLVRLASVFRSAKSYFLLRPCLRNLFHKFSPQKSFLVTYPSFLGLFFWFLWVLHKWFIHTKFFNKIY